MKSLRTLSGLLLLPAALTAAPVSEPTPIRAEPKADAAVLTVLSPGTAMPAPAPATSAPSGWIAVQLSGPHEVYVDNRDLTKALDVKPGSVYRTEPSTNAPVLGQAAEGDRVEIIGLRGRWTQMRLEKDLVGFVQGQAAAPAAATAARSAGPAETPPPARAETPAPRPTPPPAAQPTAPTGGPGRAVPMAERDDHGGLPRLFEGRFVSTRSPLRPRRPFDFALENESGTRIAYVDISRLLLTDQIENYIGRHVSAYGATRPVPNTRDIVVTAESLQLR